MKLLAKVVIGIAALFVIGGAIAWYIIGKPSGNDLKTVKLEKQDLTQEVSFTGRLKSVNKAQIAFEFSGTAEQVSVAVGDKVEAGQTLVALDDSGQKLELARARADRLSGQEKAKVAWEASKSALEKTIDENSKTLEAAKESVRSTKADLDEAKKIALRVSQESGDESSTTKIRQAAVASAEAAYKAAQKQLSVTQTTVNKIKQAAEDTVISNRTAYIATTQSSSDVTGLSSLEVSEALANLRIAKSVAVAPFDGIVTAKSIEAGELAVAGQPVVTVETIDDLEITADVPESDITKLKTGMNVVFTLDAYTDNDTWEGVISSIAPAAKLLEGVPTYEVTMRIAKPDDRLKPGMTANVTIVTAKRSGVLAVPRRALVKKDSGYVVTVVRSEGAMEDVPVEAGLYASDGLVEIMRGLSVGDEVIISGKSGS